MLTHFHGNRDTADIVDEVVCRMGYAFENEESAPLVAQMVMNPPAMWETWVQSLGWDDPLQKGKATHSSNLAWRAPWTEGESLRLQGDQTNQPKGNQP